VGPHVSVPPLIIAIFEKIRLFFRLKFIYILKRGKKEATKGNLGYAFLLLHQLLQHTIQH
jgi:hypothetical protein